MGSHRLAFASRRLIQLVPVVLEIASFNFVLIHLAPGDAADVIAGQGGYSTPEYVAELRREFGLDKPLYQQYFIYIGRVLTLDLGFSPVQQKPVMTLILERLPATIILVFSAIAMAVGFGILLGIISAARRGSIIDTLVTVGALLFYATPAFWFGLMLIVLFSLKLDLLPSAGMQTIASGKVGIDYVLDVTYHLILPAITMALYYLAIYTRLMRASMLEVYNLDFVRNRAGQGPCGAHRRVEARRAKRVAAGGDYRRVADRSFYGRLGAGGDDIRLARTRSTGVRCLVSARYEPPDGDLPDVVGPGRPRQSHG